MVPMSFAAAISAASFPQDMVPLVAQLLSGDGTVFAYQETTLFDYKEEFPFSFSDEYFDGIVRLVCALNNTYGGFIIFGVHDKKHTGGHNKVRINIERFNNRLREVLNNEITCVHNHCETAAGAVDLLLVPKRAMGVPPTRTVAAISDKTKVGIIWLRKGHEVLRAGSKDISLLYGDREDALNRNDAEGRNSIPNALPPSPSTLHQFIGRTNALDELFEWLVGSEDPRCFLYGSGGFGKTTIAYEFASIIANSGGRLPIYGSKLIERVIFLSAKEKYLNPITGVVGNFIGTDFSNADELFLSILQLSDWSSDISSLSTLNSRSLAKEVEDLLNLETQLVVIDDIDTLTAHQRRDAGMDVLYRILSRCKSGTKVLYTQRGLPSQSIESSIEVSALPPNDFHEFVLACCEQFKVPAPTDEMLREMRIASEGRPLAIEIIVGLRRRSGDYKKALELWKKDGGVEARQYLFDREYNVLPTDGRARNLLAALTLLDKAATFRDLQNILMFDDQQLSDAIAAVRDMFLVPGENSEGDTVYQLGEATKAYVREVSNRLDRIGQIRERVRYYLNQSNKKPNKVVEIESRCDRHLKNGDWQLAWRAVADSTLPEALREHPAFLALLGRVAATCVPSRLTEARNAFERANALQYRDGDMMETWFRLEQRAGYATSAGLHVCDLVIEGNYPPSVRAKFLQFKGTALYWLGRSELAASPLDALKQLRLAMTSNLSAYETVFPTDVRDIAKFEEYLRNSGYFYFQSCLRYGDPAELLDLFADLRSVLGPLDPLEGPIRWLSEQLQRIHKRSPIPRLEGGLRKIAGYGKDRKNFNFHDPNLRESSLSALAAVMN